MGCGAGFFFGWFGFLCVFVVGCWVGDFLWRRFGCCSFGVVVFGLGVLFSVVVCGLVGSCEFCEMNFGLFVILVCFFVCWDCEFWV